MSFSKDSTFNITWKSTTTNWFTDLIGRKFPALVLETQHILTWKICQTPGIVKSWEEPQTPKSEVVFLRAEKSIGEFHLPRISISFLKFLSQGSAKIVKMIELLRALKNFLYSSPVYVYIWLMLFLFRLNTIIFLISTKFI